MSAPLEIRAARPEDTDAILESFREAYRDAVVADPNRARSAAELRWAQAENPVGPRAFVALAGARVVAHFSAWPARFWIGGRERICGQISDLFALESSIVPRALALARTADAFFAAHAGRADGDALYFGWPIERALRHGERHLQYEVLRPLQWLYRPLASSAGATGNASTAGEAEVLETFDEQARFLWERCADELRNSAIRDAAQLRWRYLAHPTRRYVALGVRGDDGFLRGLAVLARDPSPEPGVRVVAEWLVPSDERRVAERLLSALETHAAAEGAHTLATSLPPWSPWFALLQERGFRVHPSAYATVVRSFDRALDLDTLRRTLWTVPGDGDLV